MQISCAALCYYQFGDEDDEEISKSFLNFLPSNEAQVLRQFKTNGLGESEIADIFTELNIFTKVTKENVEQLILRAGKMALIRNPRFLSKTWSKEC